MSEGAAPARPNRSPWIREHAVEGAMLPEQFAGIWHTTNTRSSEQRLALAMLERTMSDLAINRFARRRKRQRLYLEAYDWVASDDVTWPYSFVNTCQTLGVTPAKVRAALIHAPLHAFTADDGRHLHAARRAA